MASENEEQGSRDAAQGESPAKGELPSIDFSTLLLSLSSSALYQMGLVPDPVTGELATPDRVIAQHSIETLEMLHEKTRGNLDEEETKLFESLLYELRMHFVKIPADD